MPERPRKTTTGGPVSAGTSAAAAHGGHGGHPELGLRDALLGGAGAGEVREVRWMDGSRLVGGDWNIFYFSIYWE